MKLQSRILSLNAGSSSIRFAVHEEHGRQRRLLSGKVERVGQPGTTLSVSDASGHAKASRHLAPRSDAVVALLQWFEAQPWFAAVSAIGHRVVHGMHRSAPERVTARSLARLKLITPLDPDHLPGELHLMSTLLQRHPKIPQFACFDTAFHQRMPPVAKRLAIPRRYAARGVQRYGFHGLSYEYLLEELQRLDPVAARGRVILAHLGSGASLAAVRAGKPLDTTMGFTPASGLVMGTRSGDLDPGLGYYLSKLEGMSSARFQKLVNHESGLLGVSATSSDLRDLQARESSDARAAEAIELFCYQARKAIGSFAAVLGGLDTLVFSAGIGENSAAVRERICAGLGFLGVRLSRPRNRKSAALISTESSAVAVRIIATDEERMIARAVSRMRRSR